MTFNWKQYFEKRPCQPALDWIKEEGIENMQEAWQKCHRGDWMAWALEHHRYGLTKLQRVEIAVKLIRETPVGDGRTVFDLLTDKRSINAIEVAERYVASEASDDELYVAAVAASASSAASAAARAAASASAAWAAEWAADEAAAWVADAMASEAADAAVNAAAARKAQAGIIREWWPAWVPEQEI